MIKFNIFRPRLLPLVIIAAGLMLTVRVGGIWEDIRDGVFSVEQQTAKAQSQEPPPPEPAAAAEDAPVEGAPDMAPKMQGPGMADVAPDQANVGDPSSFTQTEIDVLQKLAERREGLDSREREIDAREALVQAAENKVNDHIAELKGLKKVVEQLLAEYNTRKDEQTLRMVKVYENMKPKDAARIFDELDMVTAIMMIEAMKEVKVAALLAKMDAGKAKMLTTELTNRRQLPMPGADVGE